MCMSSLRWIVFTSFGFAENEIDGEVLLADGDGGIEDEDNDHIDRLDFDLWIPAIAVTSGLYLFGRRRTTNRFLLRL